MNILFDILLLGVLIVIGALLYYLDISIHYLLDGTIHVFYWNFKNERKLIIITWKKA